MYLSNIRIAQKSNARYIYEGNICEWCIMFEILLYYNNKEGNKIVYGWELGRRRRNRKRPP
jgi:hypothetical protein